MPVSVSVTSEKVWMKAFGARGKFDLIISTFGGSAAACAAVLKTIEIMQRDRIPERAKVLGDYARTKLRALAAKSSLIRKIRLRGLLLGIELETSGPFSTAMKEDLSVMVMGELLRKHHVLTFYYDFDPTVIRFEPPLTVTEEQIDEAVGALDAVLSGGKPAIALSLGRTAIGSILRH